MKTKILLIAAFALAVIASLACVTNPPYCRAVSSGVTFLATQGASTPLLFVINYSSSTVQSFSLTGACGNVSQSSLSIAPGQMQGFTISSCDFSSGNSISVSNVGYQDVRKKAKGK